MNADSHFVIGQTHVNGGKPCQDYAAAGALPREGSYAIVADGCSSGGRTDIGARILTLATAKALKELDDERAPYTEIAAAVRSRQRVSLDLAQSTFDLEASDLLSTCNYIVYGEVPKFIHIYGDGVVAWKLNDGQLIMARFEWADNTPLYPIYVRDNFDGFVAHHGGDLDATKLSASFWRPLQDGTYEQHYAYDVKLGRSLRGLTLPITPGMNCVAVFTDGVAQIEGVDWRDAVSELMNFKSTAGEFAKRRLNRFVKDSQKYGRGPMDDLAYAVINVSTERR
jgi:hypothetical protein